MGASHSTPVMLGFIYRQSRNACLLLFGLMTASIGLAANSPWRWTVDALPGSQFDTQQQAELALRALGGKYALAEVVERANNTDTQITYTYGAKPRGPDIGPWYNYVMQYALTNPHPTEEAAIASVIAWGDQNKGSCTGPTVVTPLNDWRAMRFWSSGDPDREARDFRVEFDVFPACDRGSLPSQAWRSRDIACPSWMAWNPTTKACELHDIAKISGDIRPPSRCDKVGNPCSTGNGTKSLRETDLELGWIQFERHYNSDTDVPYAGFGRRWSHSFSYRMVTSANGTPQGLLMETGEQLPVKSGTEPIDGSGEQLGDGAVGQKKWLRADGSSKIFNLQGRLLRDERNDGHSYVYTYDAFGRLIGVTHASGRSLQLSYYPGPPSAESRIKEITSAGSVLVSYDYDVNGILTVVHRADGTVRQYHYEDTGDPTKLTGITDESGVRFATYLYDNLGRVVSSEHANGAGRVSLSYELDGSTIVTDALGKVSTYRFTNDGQYRKPISITSEGAVQSWIFPAPSTDFRRRPTQSIDRNGNVTKYEYFFYTDATLGGTIVRTRTTEAFGTPSQRIKDVHRQFATALIAKIEEGGGSQTFTYNVRRQLVTVTDKDTASGTTRATTRSYCESVDMSVGCPWIGLLKTIDGPRTDVSDVTTFAYDTQGDIATITNAAGHVTTYNSYNAHGQPLSMTDPNGVVTTLAYDLRQRLTSRTVGGEQTSFEYWPTGLLKKATLPDGSYLEYSYDAAHRLIQINDAQGNRIEYTLDAMGNRTAEQVFDPSNALTQTRTRAFNTLNRLQKSIAAAGTPAVTTEYGYDHNGNQTQIEAPLGRDTTQSYDELNRLTQVTDPLSGTTQYAYNALDQLIAVTDPRNKVTSYTYNALGDLTQQVSPDTGTTTHTYDAAGNLKTRTDARSKTGTYVYDALNRITSLTYPDQTITYGYDSGTNQKGLLIQVIDSSGSTSWSYDPQGRVLSRQQSMGAISKSVAYSYDLHGRLQALSLPSGNIIGYGYTDGQLTSLALNGATPILSNVLYQPFGPTTGWSWGNATLAVREYDSDGQITDLDSAGLKSYSYDDAFRITGISDASDPTLSQSYGYDLLDRLTSASGTSLSQGFSYDANGNRLSQSGTQSSTYSISSNSSRLTSITGALTRSYSHDAAGNISSDGSVIFSYDDAGRMVSATKAGLTSSYAINTLGQRVKKTSSGTSTHFVYDEAGHLIGEYDSAGSLIQETIWFGDIPVAVLKPNGSGGVNLFYVHTDHLNTPRRISRPSDNAIVWRWDSDPFGTAPANEDPDGDSTLFVYHLRFPGQYYDAETGLHYNYFRDYEPQTGRYTQSDPIGLEGGLNTYAYANLNPLSFTDPFGLAPGDIFDSEAAARQDRALYVPLVEEHNSAWDVLLFGERLYLSDVYQVECSQYTYDLGSYSIGFPPLGRLGPSGKPMRHFIKHSTRKRAKDAARDAGKGPPMHHPSPRRGDSHYHPVEGKGRKIPGPHHEYPK